MEKYLIATLEPYGREPILRRMRDGSLICTFLTGGAFEPSNENVIKIARSEDDGATWSEPQTVFSHHKRGCWCTEVFTDCDHPFIVVQTYNAPSHYRELQTFRAFPDDSGKKWSEPVSFRGNINGCSLRQGIRLSNSHILIPLYWQEVMSAFDWEDKENGWNLKDWRFVSGVGISQDGGQSFQRYGDIRADVSLWEPNAVEVEPGHVIMYLRGGTPEMFISESFDYGKTWTEPVRSGIPNPDTKITLIKVRDHVLLINNFRREGRTNLCIYKSTDGKHFEKVLNVDNENERFFYPHGFADDEKQLLYLAYENGKTHWLKKYTYQELGV